MAGEGAAVAILDGEGRLLLVRENYGRRRYGYPGGALEGAETPEQGALREVLEETGATAAIAGRVGVYRLTSGFTVHLFAGRIVSGEPAAPATGEIAEVGWFFPDAIPRPVTNSLHHSLADVLAGRRDLLRTELPRLN